MSFALNALQTPISNSDNSVKQIPPKFSNLEQEVVFTIPLICERINK